MQNHWIVTADSSRAWVYEADPALNLLLVEHMEHAQGRAQDRELSSGPYGRFYGRGDREQGHSAEPEVTPSQHEQERFVRRLAEFLNQSVLEHRCAALSLYAAPAVLGLLRPLLHKETRARVQAEDNRNIAALNEHELAEWLRGHAAAGEA